MTATDKPKNDDTQAGFQRGREDYHSGRRREDNFYPPESPRHQPWFEGWDEEANIHQKD